MRGMADFEDAIKRQSSRALKGFENQVARYMQERFLAQGAFYVLADLLEVDQIRGNWSHDGRGNPIAASSLERALTDGCISFENRSSRPSSRVVFRSLATIGCCFGDLRVHRLAR